MPTTRNRKRKSLAPNPHPPLPNLSGSFTAEIRTLETFTHPGTRATETHYDLVVHVDRHSAGLHLLANPSGLYSAPFSHPRRLGAEGDLVDCHVSNGTVDEIALPPRHRSLTRLPSEPQDHSDVNGSFLNDLPF